MAWWTSSTRKRSEGWNEERGSRLPSWRWRSVAFSLWDWVQCRHQRTAIPHDWSVIAGNTPSWFRELRWRTWRWSRTLEKERWKSWNRIGFSRREKKRTLHPGHLRLWTRCRDGELCERYGGWGLGCEGEQPRCLESEPVLELNAGELQGGEVDEVEIEDVKYVVNMVSNKAMEDRGLSSGRSTSMVEISRTHDQGVPWCDGGKLQSTWLGLQSETCSRSFHRVAEGEKTSLRVVCTALHWVESNARPEQHHRWGQGEIED